MPEIPDWLTQPQTPSSVKKVFKSGDRTVLDAGSGPTTFFRGRSGWAFTLTALSIIFAVASIFMILYPRVLVSSLNPAWSLTITNAASSPYTLKIMSIVVLIFLPFVLAYQAWTYWVFRKRLSVSNIPPVTDVTFANANAK